jgi:hypothetical protein
MKNDNNNININPPLFISNVWVKGIIKNNVSVKVRRKINKDKKEKKDKKDDDEDVKNIIYKYFSYIKYYIRKIDIKYFSL